MAFWHPRESNCDVRETLGTSPFSFEGEQMSPTAIRILVVGIHSQGTNGMIAQLGKKGWASQRVEGLREAEELVGTFQFDAVLAAEALPDGRGYDLAPAIVRRAGTLLVAVALSEECLWLPVVTAGAKVLGKRALRAAALESELELILQDCERVRRNGGGLAARATPQTVQDSPRGTPPKPKTTAAA
jgi:DNA-binding response OmpR family regulator